MRPSTIAAALTCALLTGCGAGGPLSDKADQTAETTQTSDDGGREEAQTDTQDSPPDELSPDEQSLVDRLPSEVTGCEPSRDDIDERAIAQVFCDVSGFPAIYTSYANAGEMRAFYDSTESDLPPDGTCPEEWNTEGTWDLGGDVQGRFKCYDDDEGPVIEWTHNTKYIHAYVLGEGSEDREALYEAWEIAGP